MVNESKKMDEDGLDKDAEEFCTIYLEDLLPFEKEDLGDAVRNSKPSDAIQTQDPTRMAGFDLELKHYGVLSIAEGRQDIESGIWTQVDPEVTSSMESAIKENSKLVKCPYCGFQLDADLNAARNSIRAPQHAIPPRLYAGGASVRYHSH